MMQFHGGQGCDCGQHCDCGKSHCNCGSNCDCGQDSCNCDDDEEEESDKDCQMPQSGPPGHGGE